MEIKKYWNLQD